MRFSIVFLFFCLLWSGLVLAEGGVPRREENPYAFTVSPEAAHSIVEIPKLWRRFIHVYDRQTEEADMGDQSVLAQKFWNALSRADYWGLGVLSAIGLDAAMSGRSLEGATVSLGTLGVVLSLSAANLLKKSHASVLPTVASRPEFAGLADSIAAHQTQSGGRPFSCRASYLALANPFRRSRIVSRWVPALVGVASGIGLTQATDGSTILQRAAEVLRWSPKAKKDRFQPTP